MKKLILIFLITLTIGFASCDKTESIPDRFTPLPAVNANVKFLNVSPDAPPVNFFADGQKISSANATTTGAVQGFGFGGLYPANVAYSTIPSSSAKIEAKVPDSSIVTPGAVILSTTATFAAGKFYTYTLVDSVGTQKLSAVLIEDDPIVQDATKGYFRLANFINNSSVKIEIFRSNGTLYASNANLAFKSVSAFDSLGTTTSYNIFLKNPVTNVNLDSIKSFTPVATRKYTFYARGVLGQTGSTNTKRPLIISLINF